MTPNKQDIILNTDKDNFFIKSIAANEYKMATNAIREAIKPPKKKIYRDLKKMLQEGYLIGSLKYGNNFIV